jgi:chorismate-pyruvate lyase
MNIKFTVSTQTSGEERVRPGHCTCGRDPLGRRLRVPRMMRTRREGLVQFFKDNPSLDRGDPEASADRVLGRR